MKHSDRCEECGSYDKECLSDHPIPGCGCARCLSAELAQVRTQLNASKAYADEVDRLMHAIKHEPATRCFVIREDELARLNIKTLDLKKANHD